MFWFFRSLHFTDLTKVLLFYIYIYSPHYGTFPPIIVFPNKILTVNLSWPEVSF